MILYWNAIRKEEGKEGIEWEEGNEEMLEIMRKAAK